MNRFGETAMIALTISSRDLKVHDATPHVTPHHTGPPTIYHLPHWTAHHLPPTTYQLSTTSHLPPTAYHTPHTTHHSRGLKVLGALLDLGCDPTKATDKPTSSTPGMGGGSTLTQ